MAVTLDTRFINDLLLRAQGMVGLANQVSEFLLKSTANIGEATAKKARELTPRSPGSGPHIADGWRSQATPIPGGISVRIFNVDPRATRKMVLATGRQTNYTLLDILEYGSPKHDILPVNGPYLVFFWPRAGRIIRLKRVSHPGTRPYAMLGLSKIRADIELKKTIDAIQRTLAFIAAGRPRGGLSGV